jgi:hypothetical protein
VANVLSCSAFSLIVVLCYDALFWCAVTFMHGDMPAVGLATLLRFIR